MYARHLSEGERPSFEFDRDSNQLVRKDLKPQLRVVVRIQTKGLRDPSEPFAGVEYGGIIVFDKDGMPRVSVKRLDKSVEPKIKLNLGPHDGLLYSTRVPVRPKHSWMPYDRGIVFHIPRLEEQPSIPFGYLLPATFARESIEDKVSAAA
jgi:hypothetical protein